MHDAGTLTHTLPHGVVQSEPDRRRAAKIWGLPVENIDPQATHTALSMFRALERGDIRFLWIQATNPMVSLPNLDRYRRAAARNDRFLVVSEAYPTPTTDVADVILPAPGPLEKPHYDLALYQLAARNVANYSPAILPTNGVPEEWVTMARLAGVVMGQGPDADVAAIDEAQLLGSARA